ncbi:hypothetical protein [Mycobacterium sp. IS-1742]|uniref:hypothetical protein n=1 Tax=Mycobacterium sp. IS-1742 TaxID=1772285 RepID=UPI000A82C0B9|nr:hypothetical protein [Mycobacterium sp. IS-1742]
MTALQDWLSLPAAAPRAVGSFVWGPLRSVLPSRPDAPEGYRLMRPGLERC